MLITFIFKVNMTKFSFYFKKNKLADVRIMEWRLKSLSLHKAENKLAKIVTINFIGIIEINQKCIATK